MADQQTNARTVFISVDGSKHSKRAFDYYLDSVCKSQDHVIVFHVQEIPKLGAAPYPYTFQYYEDWEDSTKMADEEAKALLRSYGDILKNKAGVTFRLVKEGGNPPGDIICKNIKDENAKVVIMGSRGQGTVRRTILGSVSDYVVHHSHVPVCIVPPLETKGH